MTLWKSAKTRKVYETALDSNLKQIVENLGPKEAIDVIPLAPETEVGDYGKVQAYYTFLIVWGTPYDPTH